MTEKRKVKAVKRPDKEELKKNDAPPSRRKKIMTEEMKAMSERKKAEKAQKEDKEVPGNQSTDVAAQPPKPFDKTHTRKTIYFENHHLKQLEQLKETDRRSITRLVNEALSLYFSKKV